ncbi:MAG: chloride channel protein [Phycisphaerales bacterium]
MTSPSPDNPPTPEQPSDADGPAMDIGPSEPTPDRRSDSDDHPAFELPRFARVARFIARNLSRIGLNRERRLLLWAALTGVVLACIALAFIKPIQWAEAHAVEWLNGSDARAAVAIAIVPVLGALLCGAIQTIFPTKLRAHGVSSVLYAIHRRRAQLPGVLAIRTWLGSTAIIASGGSAGPEGPIVTIGATLGSVLARLLRVDAQTATTLVGCGAAAGLAAVFNAPITGIFFVLEVLLRDFSLRTFTPIVIASVFAAATVQTLLGSQQPLFGISPEHVASGGSAGLTIGTTPAFLLLGLACGIASVFFVRTVQSCEIAFNRFRVPRWLLPATGAAMLSTLGLLHVIGGDRIDLGLGKMPSFYGNGYDLVHQVLDPEFYDRYTAMVIAAMLFGLAVVKCVATGLTLGSGAIGGMFAPSLVVGALVGAAVGSMGEVIPAMAEVGPTKAALAGMAGVVAGTTHAPLAGAMLVYELSREPTILLPVILVAVLSTIVARLLERHSVYTAELAALGVQLGTTADLTALRRLRVGDVHLLKPITVKGSASVSTLLQLADDHEDFIVLDDAGRLEGIVGARDLQIALINQEALPLLQIRDIARTDIKSVDRDLPLDQALDHLERGPLPVRGESGEIIGLLTRGRLMRAWRRRMEREE